MWPVCVVFRVAWFAAADDAAGRLAAVHGDDGGGEVGGFFAGKAGEESEQLLACAVTAEQDQGVQFGRHIRPVLGLLHGRAHMAGQAAFSCTVGARASASECVRRQAEGRG